METRLESGVIKNVNPSAITEQSVAILIFCHKVINAVKYMQCKYMLRHKRTRTQHVFYFF